MILKGENNMKKLLSIMLILLFILSSLNITSYANNAPFTRGSFCSKVVELLEIEYDVSNFPQIFVDVPKNDENYEAITTIYMLGYISDDNMYAFMPDDIIYKSEAVAILISVIFGEITVPDDVELSDHWCAKYAWKAKEEGIIYDSNKLNEYAKIGDFNIDQIRKYAPFTLNIEESGTCGENLTWKYTQDGILTINGTGRMTDFTSSWEVPWYGKRYFKVIIGEGVTSVGETAFFSSHVYDVSLPNYL